MPILQKTVYTSNTAPLSVPDRDRTKQQLTIAPLSMPGRDHAKQEKQNTMHLSMPGRDHAKQNSNSVPLAVLDRDHANRQLTITQLSILDRNNPNASPLELFVFSSVEFLIAAAGGVFFPGPLERTKTKQEERFLQYDERTCLQLLQGREPP